MARCREPQEEEEMEDRSNAGADVGAEKGEQYSLARILGIWVLAALPMGVLSWIVFPALSPDFGSDPLGAGVTRIVLLTFGLAWLFIYSGPMNSDSKMGVAKVHSDHDPQTLHARPESCPRAGTVQGRRDPAADRVPAWRPSQSAAKMESAGVGRSA